MHNHSPPDSHAAFSNQLPFPLNIGSRIWRRLWHGILSSCQRASLSNSRPNIPLPPDPIIPFEHPRTSSPSCRPVQYDHVSTLLDVDYLRGPINTDGRSQGGNLKSLHVINPDLHTQSSRAGSYYGTFDDASRVGRRGSHVPCLPDLWFTTAPAPPLSVTIGLGLQNLAESPMPESQPIIHIEPSSSHSTETTSEELLPSPALDNYHRRARGLPPSGFSRAMKFFLPPSPCISEDDVGQGSSSGDDTQEPDTVLHRTRSHIPSVRSSRESSSCFTQRRGHWRGKRRLSHIETQPLIPDSPRKETIMPGYRYGSPVVFPSENTEKAQSSRGPGRSRRVSSTFSNSTSPIPMSEAFSRRQRGIFLNLYSLPFLSQTLTAGTVAQSRRRL
ncbi:hypothetical protein N7454_009449 [Penicillium verhagenii]|nr:hypothetical protein N7454_009449 [Penicillium verhagenii]